MDCVPVQEELVSWNMIPNAHRMFDVIYSYRPLAMRLVRYRYFSIFCLVVVYVAGVVVCTVVDVFLHCSYIFYNVLNTYEIHVSMSSSGARFTKYRTTILRLSYDNAKVTIDLRRTSNLQNILRRAQGFS